MIFSPRLVLTALIAMLMVGCVNPGDQPASGESDRGLLPKLGSWRGKKAHDDSPASASASPAGLPVPQKLPIGSVHLVHASGGFVLIRTSRTAAIPAEAELATYDERGRPTGKLKLSPERKGAFLAADIVGGNPGANDRVVMYSYLDEGGQMRFDTAAGDGGEVLE